jgi:site-specific DNA-methyltransferase (adenine-specific)
MELNNIYCGNCIDIIKILDDDSIDLVVTSPPYNVDLGNNKFNNDRKYDLYDDNKCHEEYILFLKQVFEGIFLKLKLGGRVCINIGDSKNGKICTHSDIIQLMKDIGYLVYTTIIWDKMNTSNRTAWGSWLSPSCPSFPTSF